MSLRRAGFQRREQNRYDDDEYSHEYLLLELGFGRCRYAADQGLSERLGEPVVQVEVQLSQPVRGVELVQIAGDAVLDLRHAPLHLRPGEVLVTVVHRLELATVNRHAGFGEQPNGATQRNEPAADLADGAALSLRKSAIVL